jgi:hypothetical protein
MRDGGSLEVKTGKGNGFFERWGEKRESKLCVAEGGW